MLKHALVPIVGIAAWSGTGKTTLLTALLQRFAEEGLRVGVIKHAHHTFDIDMPGKDSYELRKAGARQMLVASKRRTALVVERASEADPTLDELLLQLDQEWLDLILVEGFKSETFPKIELHRPALGHPLLFPHDPHVIAIATDAPLPVATELPLLDLNRIDSIADFIHAEIKRQRGAMDHAQRRR